MKQVAQYSYVIHLKNNKPVTDAYEQFDYDKCKDVANQYGFGELWISDKNELVMDGAVVASTKQGVKGLLSEAKAALKTVFDASKITLNYEMFGNAY